MFLFVLHSIGVGEGVVARTGGGAQAGLLVGGFFARRDAEGYEHTQHTCTNTERYREMKNQGGGGASEKDDGVIVVVLLRGGNNIACKHGQRRYLA